MQRSVLEYLENSAQKFPDKTVFADEEHEISYQEFQNQTKAVGTGLARDYNVGRNQPVAVFIERNIECLISFFGIVYSGNFYVPVDAAMPVQRIGRIFDTLKPAAVIVSERTKKVMDQMDYDGHILNLEELKSVQADQEILDQITRKRIDTDPLYAIFTDRKSTRLNSSH